MGIGGVYGDAFANNGVLTVFSYAAFGMKPFIFYLIGCGVAFFGAAILTYLIGFEDLEGSKTGSFSSGDGEDYRKKDRNRMGDRVPVEGEAIALSEVDDEVFASEALGKGIAILPQKGEVLAPADGTVTVIYPTLHAIGLKLSNGVELLIHVGIDTVKLEGKYFKKYVEEGAQVKKGEKIMGFDLEKIKAAGYDPTVMVVVGNTKDYETVTGLTASHADSDTPVIKVAAGE